MYNGTDFVLLNYNKSSSSTGLSVFTLSDDILSLTSSSTAANIVTAFGSQSNINNFIATLQEQSSIIYFIGDKMTSVLCAYTTVGTTNTIDTIQLIIPSTKKLKTIALTRLNSSTTYTSVAVTEEDLGGSNITVENSLASDSTTNPPSVHAVNEAIGQIDTILNSIINS